MATLKLLTLTKEGKPNRCEVCHQSDEFNPETNHCARCSDTTSTVVTRAKLRELQQQHLKERAETEHSAQLERKELKFSKREPKMKADTNYFFDEFLRDELKISHTQFARLDNIDLQVVAGDFQKYITARERLKAAALEIAVNFLCLVLVVPLWFLKMSDGSSIERIFFSLCLGVVSFTSGTAMRHMTRVWRVRAMHLLTMEMRGEEWFVEFLRELQRGEINTINVP